MQWKLVRGFHRILTIESVACSSHLAMHDAQAGQVMQFRCGLQSTGHCELI